MSLTEEQAGDFADRFLELAEAVKTYRTTHRSELSEEERETLKDAEIDLRNRSSEFTTAAVGAALGEAQVSLEELMNVTARTKAAVESVQHVKKAIGIATAAMQLGAAIASQNPAAIRSAANNLCAEVRA